MLVATLPMIQSKYRKANCAYATFADICFVYTLTYFI